MEEIYKTVTLSRRHKENGSCEDHNFGKIKLMSATKEETPKICTIKDYRLNQTLLLFKGDYYSDWDKWNNEFYFKEKQGRLTERTAKLLMVGLRNEIENRGDYSHMTNYHYLLVGRRIYKRWCRKSELCITQTGNMIFSSWWTVDIEPRHVNKSNARFNKKNFERVLKGARKHYEKNRNKKSDHDHFSYPRITWYDLPKDD